MARNSYGIDKEMASTFTIHTTMLQLNVFIWLVQAYASFVRVCSYEFVCFKGELLARMIDCLQHRSTSLNKCMMIIHCVCLAKPTQLKMWASWQVFGRSKNNISLPPLFSKLGRALQPPPQHLQTLAPA